MGFVVDPAAEIAMELDPATSPAAHIPRVGAVDEGETGLVPEKKPRSGVRQRDALVVIVGRVHRRLRRGGR